MCLPHYYVICDHLLHGRTTTWNLFAKYKKVCLWHGHKEILGIELNTGDIKVHLTMWRNWVKDMILVLLIDPKFLNLAYLNRKSCFSGEFTNAVGDLHDGVFWTKLPESFIFSVSLMLIKVIVWVAASLQNNFKTCICLPIIVETKQST